eukprot:NODE_6128_length_923_cov_25.142500_g5537_i0.p1 GENE.NODE_6128_length_923_cov_25.142500_g5537_i0~~NODE_6128_length_923_cov_25.142500_g5537_i0.p1  ORF type:complete len:268 (-),score=36.21 NODE_6128_length_923_cov_25.142500_g5537_i0:120-869(-)
MSITLDLPFPPIADPFYTGPLRTQMTPRPSHYEMTMQPFQYAYEIGNPRYIPPRYVVPRISTKPPSPFFIGPDGSICIAGEPDYPDRADPYYHGPMRAPIATASAIRAFVDAGYPPPPHLLASVVHPNLPSASVMNVLQQQSTQKVGPILPPPKPKPLPPPQITGIAFLNPDRLPYDSASIVNHSPYEQITVPQTSIPNFAASTPRPSSNIPVTIPRSQSASITNVSSSNPVIGQSGTITSNSFPSVSQ